MAVLSQLRALTTDQRNAFLAAYLGWTLDAFDFFVVVFVLKDIEKEFHASPQQGASVAVLRPWPAGPSGRSCSARRRTGSGGAFR